MRAVAAVVHRDNAEREFAYDRQSHIGNQDRAQETLGGQGVT
jgi:hypothetical protein